MFHRTVCRSFCNLARDAWISCKYAQKRAGILLIVPRRTNDDEFVVVPRHILAPPGNLLDTPPATRQRLTRQVIVGDKPLEAVHGEERDGSHTTGLGS